MARTKNTSDKGWKKPSTSENVTTIPHLKEAHSYDLATVILKEELSTVEKLKRETPGSLAIGTLTDFVKPENKADLVKRLQQIEASSQNINQHYVFEESDMKHNVKKTVRIEMEGGEHYQLVDVPGNESLAVDMEVKGFRNVRKFYFVSEVYYVTSMRLYVTIDDEFDELLIQNRIPIAMKFKRYKIQNGGKIGSMKEVTKSNWRVVWIKPSRFRHPMDNLPPIPATND